MRRRAQVSLALLWSPLVCLAACSWTGAERGGTCSIAMPGWPSASRDYNRRASVALATGLGKAVRADREAARVGRRNDIGKELSSLIDDHDIDGFVSDGVHEVGVRLRQLDCGVVSGRIPAAEADRRYGEILAALQGERSALGAP